MAAPNLNSVTSILGKTARSNLNTTNVVGILTNSGGSNKVLKIKLEEVNSLIPEVCKNRTVTDTDVVSLLQLIELKKELKNV